MKITDGKSDALVLVQRIHNELKELQKAIDELEYLIYEKDERCQIELFNEAWDRRKDDRCFEKDDPGAFDIVGVRCVRRRTSNKVYRKGRQ